MRSGHGDQLIAEGDPEIEDEERELVAAFRRQLDQGLWAAVPTSEGGHREAQLVRDFSEVPKGAETVIFFPPAAGG
jgi:molybdopterin converting factor small subunit